jgi:hypothetical protein
MLVDDWSASSATLVTERRVGADIAVGQMWMDCRSRSGRIGEGSWIVPRKAVMVWTGRMWRRGRKGRRSAGAECRHRRARRRGVGLVLDLGMLCVREDETFAIANRARQASPEGCVLRGVKRC